MFNRMYELTARTDYEERIRKTAQENYATRVARALHGESAALARLGEWLVHMGYHLQGSPHSHLKQAEASQ